MCLLCAAASSLSAQYGEDEEASDWPVVEGGGITFEAEAQQSAAVMAVISREEIEATRAENIPALLERVLGLGVTRYGPYGNITEVTIRGFDTERIAILLDGIPANSARSGDFDFNRIDINAVERIEVIYGGSDAKYNVSGAMGGAINIVTLKKEKPGFHLAGGLSNAGVLPGQYNENSETREPQWQDLADAQNFNFSGAYGGDGNSFRANLFGNIARNHFLYKDYYGYARRKEGNEVVDGGASFSWTRELPDYSSLILSGDFYYGDKNIPLSGYAAASVKQRDFSSRQSLMLEMPRFLQNNMSMEASLSRSGQSLEYDPGPGASIHREQCLSLIARWNIYLSPEFIFRTGLDYRYVFIDSSSSGRYEGHRGGSYIAAEYVFPQELIPAGKLLVNPSLKTAFNAALSPNPSSEELFEGLYLTAVPKLGLIWQAGERFSVKNNYFRIFKFPDFDDLYWEQGGFKGNPALKPEDGWGSDLGAAYNPESWLFLDGVFHTAWTKDSIHWSGSGSGGAWAPQNIGEAFIFGLDARLQFELPLSAGPLTKIRPGLSYGYLQSYLLSGNLDFASNKRIPYMPQHILGLSLDLYWNQSSLSISGRFESSRFADTWNLVRLEPYFLLNAAVNQRVGENLTVFGSLRNALNAQYVSFADYPMPGLNFTIGARFNFDLSQTK
jgi:vitamin B12 transporter